MVGHALVCFRAGTTDLLQGDVSISEECRVYFWHTKCQNVKLYPCFQHFHLVPRLDNCASGIPNAIISQLFGGRNNAAANADPRLPSPGTPIECAQATTVLMPARVADELKNRRQGEEANVEFQRCGPQDTRSGQSGQTHESDGT